MLGSPGFLEAKRKLLIYNRHITFSVQWMNSSVIWLCKLNFETTYCRLSLGFNLYYISQHAFSFSSQEQARQNVVPCQGKITSGMFLNSTIGYVRVADSNNPMPTFNLVPGFSLNLTFRSAAQAGTLMTAWSSSSRFVTLVLTVGQVESFVINLASYLAGLHVLMFHFWCIKEKLMETTSIYCIQ